MKTAKIAIVSAGASGILSLILLWIAAIFGVNTSLRKTGL